MLVVKANENKDDWLVARIFGITLDFFNVHKREKEFVTSKLMSELEIGPPVYATFTNGIISGFVQGKTFFWNDLTPFRDVKLLK